MIAIAGRNPSGWRRRAAVSVVFCCGTRSPEIVTIKLLRSPACALAASARISNCASRAPMDTLPRLMPAGGSFSSS
jgi:hypothetical protein